MSRWLKRKYSDLITRWKSNQISLVDAANELHALGICKYEEAFEYLERI